MPGTRLLQERRHVAVGQVVVILAAFTFVLELWAVWIATESSLSWRLLAVAVFATMAVAQIASSLARRRATDPEAVGRISLGAGVCAVVLALLISSAALGKVSETGYYRLLGAVAVLDVLLVALQSVVRRLGAAPAAATPSRPGFVCVLADGRRVRPSSSARDLPSAVAATLRDFERRGERVRKIEFGEG